MPPEGASPRALPSAVLSLNGSITGGRTGTRNIMIWPPTAGITNIAASPLRATDAAVPTFVNCAKCTLCTKNAGGKAFRRRWVIQNNYLTIRPAQDKLGCICNQYAYEHQ